MRSRRTVGPSLTIHTPSRVGRRTALIDLGAEHLLGAERDTDRIAVEIKGFLGPSEVHDLEEAVGQFVLYRSLMERTDPARRLVLAVPEDVFNSFLHEPIARLVMEDIAIPVAVFDPQREVIVRWSR